MSLPSKPITVRLTPEQMKSFAALAGQFGGLAPSLVLRMLIGAQLRRPLAEQVAEIQKQICSQGCASPASEKASRGRKAKGLAGVGE